ncbi:MAG: threonine aldolase family protein [Bacteroidales bacterium]
MIDLRSDTVTRPAKAMLDLMFTAQVGDDVFGDDPTVNALEAKAAKLFGMESALFCASGTMTNQIAIKVHTRPGDEVICNKLSHIYYYEGGGIAVNSGASVCLLDGDRGRITAEDVRNHINPDDIHRPVTRLVEIENTMNKGGGAVYDYNEVIAISNVCKENDLKFHLDGARLFNALTVTGQQPADYGCLFDSISICLSKGLGAPVGSLLLGSKQFVNQARRVRKVFGGGMRQAGYLAAAGIFALDHNVTRLADDHHRAAQLGAVLAGLPFIEEVVPVETNIIFFRLAEHLSEIEFLNKLAKKNIHALALSPRNIRMVTHLDFTDDMLDELVVVLKSI